MAVPSPQTVPVQLHQADNRLVLATPMPGLEPQDIAVVISGDRVTMRGEYRGSRQEQPETLVSEWTIGPYYRAITLPQPVNGVLTNATYGNGVLVLSMPTLEPGQQGSETEFRLEAILPDTTLLFAETPSAPAFREAFKKTPLAKFFEDEEVREFARSAFKAGLKNFGDLAPEFGKDLSWEKALEGISGQIAFLCGRSSSPSSLRDRS